MLYRLLLPNSLCSLIYRFNPIHPHPSPSIVLDSYYTSKPFGIYDLCDPAVPLNLPTRVDPHTWPNVCNPPHQFDLPHPRNPSQPLYV